MEGFRLGVIAALVAVALVVQDCGADPEGALSGQPPPGSDAQQPAPPPTTGPLSAACDERTAQLNWDYLLARACESDQECNYVDIGFVVLAHEDLSHAVTSSICGGDSPLLEVASGAKVAAMSGTLKLDLKAQEQACAEPPEISGSGEYPCDAQSSAVPTAPPVCQLGLCAMPR